jgi:hypothetical protein
MMRQAVDSSRSRWRYEVLRAIVLPASGDPSASIPLAVDSRLPSLGGIALNLLVPLQAEGVHTVGLTVDGEVIKSIPFVVQVTPDASELAREQEG